MKRREFIAGLGSAAASPVAARAQQAAPRLIGVLTPVSFDPDLLSLFSKVAQGLAETGYREGQNVKFEYRWAQGAYDRMPDLVADLIQRRVDVIVAWGTTPGALAAKAATQSIPVVYLIGTDPVKIGLATSLARPGGNLTGVTVINVELIGKCLEIMHLMIPAATTIAVLVNPANPAQTETEIKDVQAAARSLGLRVLILSASRPDDIDQAFASAIAEGAGGLLVGGDSFFGGQIYRLCALEARHMLPTIWQYREFIAAGGLMYYGPDVLTAYLIVGNYVGRILNGEKPADLPVQQHTKIQLGINLKTAKALRIEVPIGLLGRADEVIE
jgi:putative ABC transport system substrate-binding protein